MVGESGKVGLKETEDTVGGLRGHGRRHQEGLRGYCEVPKKGALRNRLGLDLNMKKCFYFLAIPIDERPTPDLQQFADRRQDQQLRRDSHLQVLL